MNILNNVKKALPAVGGGLLANFGSNKLASFIGNDKLRAGAVFLAGLAIMSSKKFEYVGVGLATIGGTKLVGSFVPALAGYDDLSFDTDMAGVVNGGTAGVVNGNDYYDNSNSNEY